MTPNELDQQEAAAREVIAALGQLSHDVQVPPDFLPHVLAEADMRSLPRRGPDALDPVHDIATDPELRAAYRDLRIAFAHPQLRAAVLTALRAFAQVAERGRILPPSGAGCPLAATGAVNTPSSPPSSDAIEPLQRFEEFHAVREEPMVNPSMVSQSPAMREVLRRLERVLHTTATVLIMGEPGTGKGLIARMIHDRGPRRQGAFIAVKCAAVAETLLEAELFSHMERAAGGTLFVDGVAEMSPTLQAKLLRVLQEGRFERPGGTETLPTEARIIAAATPELERLMIEGRFRRDLFYRLNAFPIVLPALRERREDIIPLTVHFLSHYCRALRKEGVGLSEDAGVRLMDYAWPGNVRELMQVIEQAVRRCQGPVVAVEDLPPALWARGS
ncbi:MAG TPA: sigma 54-interacting transcriptional regulator [Candidatus Tectomicrobia bacterium]|nr:sigma 54-interacting transcriptional regulator [Candidatus Tectomicrobia bacterium]